MALLGCVGERGLGWPPPPPPKVLPGVSRALGADVSPHSVCWDQSVTSLTRREGDSDVTSLPPSVGGRKRSVPSALPAPPGTPRRPSMGGGDDCGAPTTPPSWGPQLPAGDGDHCDPHITS